MLIARLLPAEAWRRNQNAMLGIMLTNFLGFSIPTPFTPLYIQQLGVSDPRQAALWAGVLLAIGPLTAALLLPLWGLLADRVGHKYLLWRSVLGFSLTGVLTALVQSPGQLLAIRLFEGLFTGFSAMCLGYIAANTPRERLSQCVGELQASQLVALIAGPLLGGVIVSAWGIRIAWLVTTAVYLTSLPFLLIAGDPPKGPRTQNDAGGRGTAMLRAMKLANVAPATALLFLFQFIDRSFQPILPLYVEALGTAPEAVAPMAGVIVSLGALATAVSSVAVGRLARSYPPRRLLLAAAVAGMVLCLPMSVVRDAWQLLVLRTLLGLLAGGAITLAYSAGGASATPSNSGTVFATLSMGNQFGSAGGPFLVGLLANRTLPGVFILDALLYGLSLLVSLAVSVRPGRAAQEQAGRPPEPAAASQPGG